MSENEYNVTNNEVDENDLKTKFMEKVMNLRQTECSFHIKTAQKYEELISEVESAKQARKKTTLQYRRLKRYDVLSVGDVKKLIMPLSDNMNVQYYVTDDELFDVIKSAHRECGHGGRDRTLKVLRNKYANVTKECINFYLDLCVPCQKKKTHTKKKLVVKPLLFKETHARAQVDLIDMQTCPDHNFKYILNYQDHLTKFVILRPMQTKTAEEVTHILLDIFCILGAPSVLQSDNGREFANRIIEELKVMWPELAIVHGKPRHSQSQGSVERANQDVQKILFAWIEDNKTNRWSEGLKFCQLQKNCAYHTGIRQTPFEVMFGKYNTLVFVYV